MNTPKLCKDCPSPEGWNVSEVQKRIRNVVVTEIDWQEWERMWPEAEILEEGEL